MEGQEPNPSAVGYVEDRKSDGTFAEGNTVSRVSGGASEGGRRTSRREEWRQIFNDACKRAISPERMLRIVNAAAEAAENGDIRAAHELLDRLLGKADQYTENVVETVATTADPEAVELLQKIALRHLQRLSSQESKN